MIADATGAREVLKKQKKRGIFDEDMGHNEMNIFEILQMFRDHRGNAVAGEREQSMRIVIVMLYPKEIYMKVITKVMCLDKIK